MKMKSHLRSTRKSSLYKMLVSPKLSTMVVLHTLDMKLDTERILHTLPLSHTIIKIEKRGVLRRGESKRDRIKRRNAKEVAASGFGHNSVTLVLLDDGYGRHPMKEVTVKIFHNGVFHMTGVLHADYEQSTLEKLKNIFLHILEDSCFKGARQWVPVARRVVLMNYTTRLPEGFQLSRMGIQRYFQDKGIHAEFEPDVSPSVKVQFPQKWTACIFRTGKINLTALTSEEDCQAFVELLGTHMEEYGRTQ
jgi:hypothetical protein